MEKITRYCDALIESSWLLVLLVTPLFFMVEAFRISEPIKIFVFRSIIWFELAVWIIKSLFTFFFFKANKISSKSDPSRIPIWKTITKQPVYLFILSLFLVYLLSTIFSISPFTSFFGSYTRNDGLLTHLTYLIYFGLFFLNLQSRDQVERIIIVLALVCLTIDGYAILQHFHLDPLSWPKFEANSRIVSTFGHPIFAAAFLSTATFITLPHTLISIRKYLNFLKENSPTQRIKQSKQIPASKSGISYLIHSSLFGLICLLNIVSIWFTVSRGPILGFIVGMAFFIILALYQFRMRRLLFITFGAGILLFLFLLILNIPSGPLKVLRDAPVVGPLGHLFDAETGTGQTRVLIWKGMSKLTGLHAPLVFPDQTYDKLNSIRWLLGYGPDSLLYAYESFYDPQSYILEAPNVIYDRSHNRFWDVLGFNGISGILTEYGLLLYIFFVSLKNIRVLTLSGEKKLFWLLSTIGSLLGVILPLAVSKPEYIGILFHFGLLLGPAWIIFQAVFLDHKSFNSTNIFSTLINIGLFSALISHYIELSTGILTINSSLLFWLVSTLILLSDNLFSVEFPKLTNFVNNKLFSRSNMRIIGFNAIILMLILVTFGSRFILNTQNDTDTSVVLLEGLTTVQNPEPHTSYGILILLFSILIIGSLLLNTSQEDSKYNWNNILITCGFASLFSTLLLILRSNQLADIYRSSFENKDPLSLIHSWINLSTTLLLLLFFFLLILSIILTNPNSNSERTVNLTNNKKKNNFFTPLFLWITTGYILSMLILYFIISFNVIPIQSDILYEKAWVNNKNGNPKMASFIFDQLIILAPKEPEYQRFAYQLLFNRISNSTNANEKELFYQTGIEHLKTTYQLEPLFVYNTEALADFYRLGGQISNNAAEKNVRFYFADMYYAAAVKIKPSRVDYWLGWAGLCADKNDFSCAEQKFNSALYVNPEDANTYQYAAELYSQFAKFQTDPTMSKQYFESALRAYQHQADLLSRDNKNSVSAYLGLTDSYLQLQQVDQANNSFKQLIEKSIQFSSSMDWGVYYQISELAGKLKKTTAQVEFLQKAINIAPSDQLSMLNEQLHLINP